MSEICSPLLVPNAIPVSLVPCCGPGVTGREEDVSGIAKGTQTGMTVKVTLPSGWIVVPELQRDGSKSGEQLCAGL